MSRHVPAALAAGATAIAGYAGLLLLAGLPDPHGPIPIDHVPFFWRCATATWWAALGGVVGWRLGDEALWTRALWVAVAFGVATAVAVPLATLPRYAG